MMSHEAKILNLFALHRGPWMSYPDNWVWTTPARQPQGFGLHWRDNVGLANLLWLALDMERPPAAPYNMRYHQLCMLFVVHGAKMELDGLPIFSQAEALTLAQFRNLCLSSHFAAPAPVHNIAPLLVTLANRRLEHAHA